ncbi:Adherance factor, partial [Phytophthora palmivora]
MGKARTLSRRRAHSGASGHSGGSGDSRGEDYWQAPSLTASERAYMIRKAKEASVALVDHAHTLDGPVQWHYTGKFRGIQMYRGEGSYDRVGTTGTEFLCGVTTMMGSIEEVANYFDQQTTERMLAKKADDVLDCEMLYALVQGDHNNPYYRVSAKYQLYEGPSAFSRERDYCFLECQNTFRHASGRRGWVLSMHSIKLPSCPEVDGVVRGSMYQSGYVFVEAEKEGYMDVMHSLQINFKSTSRLPHFLLNSALKRRILSVVTISREIQTTRMGRQTLLRKKDLMPKRARALCVNCSRKFSLFVRKTRCRVCGEVVCQPCAPQVMISTKRGPVKTRVCMRCYHLSSSDEYEPVGALPTSQNGGDPRRMQNETRYSDILQDHHDHPDLYHEEDEDSMEEDGDEDGLEEQSDYSVFAQSRFTDASRDSVATSQFGASRSQFESHFEGSSQFDTSSELDDSQYYDGGASETSFVSGVSGTSTSYWHGGNSGASSMAGWNQASSVKPADGYIYDPQSSMMSSNSNFYGASNYKSEYGGSNHSADDEPKKRAG